MSDLELTAAPGVAAVDVLWRVDTKPWTRNGQDFARYVPYVNASIVADLFDRWIGPENWEDEYTSGSIGNRPVLWCTITVTLPDGRRVSKRDVGVMPKERNEQKGVGGMSEKGAVSDAFKRCAALKWGVGRNVYQMPTLVGPVEVTRDGKARSVPGVEKLLADQLRTLGHGISDSEVKVEAADGRASAGDADDGLAYLPDPVDVTKSADTSAGMFAEWPDTKVLAAARALAKATGDTWAPTKIAHVWQRVDDDVDFGAKLYDRLRGETGDATEAT